MVSVVERDLPHNPKDSRYRIGIGVALVGIIMMFTAFTSAYVIRAGAAEDWRPIAMPRILLLSTFLLLLSSGTLELARQKIDDFLESRFRGWLMVTVALGFSFLILQIFAWRHLAAQGIFIATNPHSSFFYLLTGLHGLHLLGGLLALLYLLRHSRFNRSKARAEAVSIYWHSMDALWIFLFLLLFLWR
jgi:cytochrome c oxidase subunit 3